MISYFDGWLQVRIREESRLLVPPRSRSGKCKVADRPRHDVYTRPFSLDHQWSPYLSGLGAAQLSNATAIRSQPLRASAQLHPLRAPIFPKGSIARRCSLATVGSPHGQLDFRRFRHADSALCGANVGLPLTWKVCRADTKGLEEAVPFDRGSIHLPRQQSSETFVARSLIDIGALDVRVQEQVAKYGSIKDFHVVLWRQDPDATGCNWNARIERIGGSLSDSSWWDVVPQMRERFNLN